jgi:hypothetical protein
VTPEVDAAIEEIKRTWAGHHVDVVPEPQGGAYVTVHDLRLGDQYQPATSWVGFLITFQYPRADVYPHFLTAELRRVDGQALGESFQQPIPWCGQPATQVSRRSNHLDPAVDTAATKLAKVLAWVRSR